MMRISSDLRFRTLLLRSSSASLLFLAFAMAVSCAPVRTLDSRYETINIPMVANRSLEYGAEERVTDTIIQEFNLDGRLRVSSLSSADTILDATIVDYEIASVIRDDRGETIGSQVNITLAVSFVDAGSGALLVPSQTYERSGVFFFSTQPGIQRERDVVAQIAEDVVSYVIEGW